MFRSKSFIPMLLGFSGLLIAALFIAGGLWAISEGGAVREQGFAEWNGVDWEARDHLALARNDILARRYWSWGLTLCLLGAAVPLTWILFGGWLWLRLTGRRPPKIAWLGIAGWLLFVLWTGALIGRLAAEDRLQDRMDLAHARGFAGEATSAEVKALSEQMARASGPWEVVGMVCLVGLVLCAGGFLVWMYLHAPARGKGNDGPPDAENAAASPPSSIFDRRYRAALAWWIGGPVLVGAMSLILSHVLWEESAAIQARNSALASSVDPSLGPDSFAIAWNGILSRRYSFWASAASDLGGALGFSCIVIGSWVAGRANGKRVPRSIWLVPACMLAAAGMQVGGRFARDRLNDEIDVMNARVRSGHAADGDVKAMRDRLSSESNPWDTAAQACMGGVLLSAGWMLVSYYRDPRNRTTAAPANATRPDIER